MVLVPKSIISIPFNTNGLIQLQFPPSPCRGPYRLRDSKAGHAVGGLKVLAKGEGSALGGNRGDPGRSETVFFFF